MSLYMPRHGFADFLRYVADGQGTVYVVPRGMIKHDTAWAEVALEPYREAWHLLKETTASLFERKMEPLSIQLRKIIAEAGKHNLSHQLIRSKRSELKNDYRTFMQRRILIQDKRCAIFTAKLLPGSSHPWPTAIFKTSSDDWAEVLLLARMFPSCRKVKCLVKQRLILRVHAFTTIGIVGAFWMEWTQRHPRRWQKTVSSYRCVRLLTLIFFANGQLLTGGFFGIGGSSRLLCFALKESNSS
jgi:hypothetical protein